jgi:hypothetical protein
MHSCLPLLLQIADAKSAYVANRELCLKLGSRVGLLSGTMDALKKHLASAHGQAHLKAVLAAVKDAQQTIAANVMPASAASSWFAKAKWIATQVKDKKKIAEKFAAISATLDRASNDLNLGIAVDVITESLLMHPSLGIADRAAFARSRWRSLPAAQPRHRRTRRTSGSGWTSRSRSWTTSPSSCWRRSVPCLLQCALRWRLLFSASFMAGFQGCVSSSPSHARARAW